LLSAAVVTLALVATAGGALLPTPGLSGVRCSNPTFSSVVLYGYVNPHGQATNYYFQYGTTSGYGMQTPLAPAGNGTVPVKVSQVVTGLAPSTKYHFRIVATSVGTATGLDHVFTTAKIPLSLQIVGVPNPVTYGDSFEVEGTLSGTGAANHAIALQANLFPFTAGFKTVGNPELTNASGGFAFPVLGLLENAELRVQTIGGPTVTSAAITENVAVRVSFHVRHVRRRGYVRLYGTVTPAEAGARVGFQLLVAGGRTVNVGGTVMRAGASTVSRFGRTVRLRHRGIYRALVQVSDGSHVSAYSAPVSVR
jgi:hypothetical protein